MLGNYALVEPDRVIEFVQPDVGVFACMDSFDKLPCSVCVDSGQPLLGECCVHEAADHHVRFDAGLAQKHREVFVGHPS